MSENMIETQPRETRAERKARLAAEREAAAAAEPNFEYLATLDPSGELSDEDRAALSALDEKQAAKVAEIRADALAIAEIEGFETTDAGEMRTATQPVRNRKPRQKAMDKVAAQAYNDWVEAGRPTTWSRMPSITYYVNPDIEDGKPGSLSDYRKLIRSAVQVVPAQSYEKDGKTIEPSGVRVRFGGDFVLTEKMAAKIRKPEKTGYTVLAWAAIDKRNVNGNGSGE